jgi:alkylation response protein AidB-like acyl-CoA dehydrogenase
MDFSLSEDQLSFQSSVRGLLERSCPLDVVRVVAAGDRDAAERVVRDLDALGVRGVMAPEADGGLELGLLDAVIIQEMIGRQCAPGDFSGAAMVIAGLSSFGGTSAARAWMTKVVSGEVRPGVALAERIGVRDGTGLRLEGGRLHGRSLFVVDGDTATHLFIALPSGSLAIVDATAQGVSRVPLRTIDATRVFSEILFDGVSAEVLTGESLAGAAVNRMTAVARLLVAADALGAMQVMLERAVAYSLERKQFGRVIGSFQAVKHMCAEMAARLEPLRALIWHAAHAFDEGSEEADLLILLAKSHAAEVGVFIARTATEVHGGMGFTDLVGLHYWFKRIGVSRQLFGAPEAVRGEAARLQGWVSS